MMPRLKRENLVREKTGCTCDPMYLKEKSISGKYRALIDMGRLIYLTITRTNTMPNIDQLLDRVDGFAWYSSLYLKMRLLHRKEQ